MLPLEPILSAIGAQYALDPSGPHGLSHWGRVLENGLRLAETTGADRSVVALFAVYHDACRLNDTIDPGHGGRGAELALAHLTGEAPVQLADTQLAQLVQACRFHTDGLVEADVTVQTCWDADRLDLLRVAIRPKPERLCTSAAQDPEMIRWASARAHQRFVPEFVSQQWAAWFAGGRTNEEPG